MCDHCAKIISQKGYAGQVTCRCDQDEKKNSTAVKEKSIGGCCSKREKQTEGGCCGSKCCAGTKQERGGCCSDVNTDEKSCCPTRK
ncbi:S-adenosyl-L-methionine-dependent tRNA 4-demethylwyosine synthase-like isoform X2 [Harpegnathos saltator]|uniref:S-adenosyl-L-methionine-dependent tRNA 4-demethylwyosine synthase-like isoform X2 n=1 Tax=Harpegnathos saltator TaxID=610380 RepID=UPI000DBEDFD6|nr:S-adenosyl-L-methionine-dependent tRNA 4-demethylwyosine synthase-like isoform X2 [Harpegnathos saltator]